MKPVRTRVMKKDFNKAQTEAEEFRIEQLAEIEDLKQRMKDENQRLMVKLEKECIKIALKVAEKILLTSIELDTGPFLSMIRGALERVGGADHLDIKLGSEDYSRIKDCDDLSSLRSEVKTLTLTEDPELNRGDCILEADHFEVDIGVNAQLENIAADLREMGVVSHE